MGEWENGTRKKDKQGHHVRQSLAGELGYCEGHISEDPDQGLSFLVCLGCYKKKNTINWGSYINNEHLLFLVL